MQKTLFRALVGAVAAALEGMRQSQSGAEIVDLGQAAALAGLVAVALVWGIGVAIRKILTDK